MELLKSRHTFENPHYLMRITATEEVTEITPQCDNCIIKKVDILVPYYDS